MDSLQHMSTTVTGILRSAENNNLKTDEARVRELDEVIGDGRKHQKQLIAKQDEQLTELSRYTERLNQTAVVINTELQQQQRMLTELDEDIERETENMNFVMRRLGILLQTSNSSQLWLILVLFGIFMFLLMFII